jgi:hypothetical protein
MSLLRSYRATPPGRRASHSIGSRNIAADFRRRAAEVEIILIKAGDLLQLFDIEQGKSLMRQRDEVVPPCGANSRVILEQVEHRSAGDRGDPRRRNRSDRMVHSSEHRRRMTQVRLQFAACISQSGLA